jgi:hypothetical protein
MKFSYVSALAALTLAGALTACGGKAQYTVQGSISGLTTSGLEISNGGEVLKPAASATSFAFSKQIDYGDAYNIAVDKSPDYYTCSVSGGSGTAGYTVSIAAAVSCSPIAYGLTGEYEGLVSVENTVPTDGTTPVAVANTVTLINGSTGGAIQVSSATGSTGTFTLASLPNGGVYSVSILTQPKNLTCTLQNAVGVIRGAAVSNLKLVCAPST